MSLYETLDVTLCCMCCAVVSYLNYFRSFDNVVIFSSGSKLL